MTWQSKADPCEGDGPTTIQPCVWFLKDQGSSRIFKDLQGSLTAGVSVFQAARLAVLDALGSLATGALAVQAP